MKKATIYTYSIVYSSTEAFADKVPYCTAILELEDGARCAAMLAGYQEGMSIQPGQEVSCIGTDDAGNSIYSL